MWSAVCSSVNRHGRKHPAPKGQKVLHKCLTRVCYHIKNESQNLKQIPWWPSEQSIWLGLHKSLSASFSGMKPTRVYRLRVRQGAGPPGTPSCFVPSACHKAEDFSLASILSSPQTSWGMPDSLQENLTMQPGLWGLSWAPGGFPCVLMECQLLNVFQS